LVVTRIKQKKQTLVKLQQLEKLIAIMNEERENRKRKALKKSLENAEDIAKQQAAIRPAEVSQEFYEDLQSEELQAGSNEITTTAEVHSHVDQAASQLTP